MKPLGSKTHDSFIDIESASCDPSNLSFNWPPILPTLFRSIELVIDFGAWLIENQSDTFKDLITRLLLYREVQKWALNRLPEVETCTTFW
jgi:hypothetical protein